MQGGDGANKSKFRFIFKNDKLTIDGKEMLHVTFDDEYRTVQFWIKRGDKAEVFVADVEVSFAEKIRIDAVPQEYGKAFPTRPQIDDITRTPNSFGIPNNYFEELLQSLKNPEVINNK